MIGRNGATIKAIVDDSGATVKASSADATPPGVTDRVITVAGEMGQCMRAVCLILQTCAEERSYQFAGLDASFRTILFLRRGVEFLPQ